MAEMQDVLRRKLGARQAPKAPGGASVEGVLRKTMPRDADAVLSMDVTVLAFATALTNKADHLAELQDSELLYLLETEDDARGLAVLDASLVSGIVEFQVSGRVSDAPPDDRPPTRTDGIVLGEIVDKWLASADATIAKVGLDAAWPLAGFERAHGTITHREAALLLEPGDLRVVDITLSLDGGAKTGRLRLSAPLSDAAGAETGASTAERVRGHLPDLRVELRAVLTRIPQPVEQMHRLSKDDLLRLPDGCLQHVRLETREGRLIREVRLGQFEGCKAVRLADGKSAVSGAPLLPQPSASELPDPLAPMPETGFPELPDLPEAPAAGPGDSDLPDLPDLPELPDLPDLPELPDLPPLS